MADTSIVTREHIRALARRAFAAGLGRDDHNMNWHAAALREWRDQYDLCVTTKQRLAARMEETA